ncbi:MAG: SDR family oxidoreductase [Rhizobiaceae bacterium]|nr:SDR family oxidoreductase [Rhizobiaceae bacterium]
MDFAGKKVIVTGAGKGIGRVIVSMLTARGATVVAMTRSAEDLDSLVAETGCIPVVVDLADLEAARAAIRAALPADYLVNNAGTTSLEPFVDTSMETIDHLMNVNLKAPIVLAQEYARDRIARGEKGAIVNISSMAAFLGVPDHTAYCATKGALDAATRVMAVELGPHGIRANCVNPVVTMTPMGIKAWSDPVKANAVKTRIPVGRFAESEDHAEATLFLLSDAASMINGVSLKVDGGFSIQN